MKRLIQLRRLTEAAILAATALFFFLLAYAAFAPAQAMEGPYGVLGAGISQASWGGGDGWWHQGSLPERVHNTTAAVTVGAGYQWTHLGLEAAYTHWWPTGLQGAFVPDKNFDPHTHRADCAPTYEEGIEQRVDGISVSLLPRFRWAGFDFYARGGAMFYRESSHFWHVDLADGVLTQFHATAHGISAIYGVGVSLDNFALEYDVVPSMKANPQPFGGEQTLSLMYRLG